MINLARVRNFIQRHKAGVGDLSMLLAFFAVATFLAFEFDIFANQNTLSHRQRMIDLDEVLLLGGLLAVGLLIFAVRRYAERKQVEEQLRESERRFTDMLSNMELLSMMLDADGQITYCNQYLLRLTGWQREEVLGQNWFKHFVPSELADEMEQVFSQLLFNQPSCWYHENEIVTRSGARCLIRWNNSVLRSLSGKVIGTASIGEDITEQRKGQERQKEMSEQLTRSNAALQEFFHIASHDLKEPLRKIQSFGNLLTRNAGPNLSPEATQYIDRMTESSNRMQVLLAALLEYAQVIGKVREKEAVDLNVIATRVLAYMRPMIEEVKPCIEIGSLPTVQADPIQMQQLFYHLIANALKYRRPEVRVQVCITAQCNTDGISLIFADNGIGFAPEYADRIFQLFERLEGSGDAKESGVGLSVCKKVVERHGGTIVAEGSDGAGATFRIWLPKS